MISGSAGFAQNLVSGPVLDLPHLEKDRIWEGSEFLSYTDSLDLSERQSVAVEWILQGNIPDFLRRLTPVLFVNAKMDTAVVWVTCDYMSVGLEEDFIRIPLSFPSARLIASSLNMYLPTATMVDSIYSQSSVKLQPIPMTPGEQMRSNAYYKRHQEMIEEQLQGVERGALIAEHKKDVVITNRLRNQPGKVAIYGWHYALHDPIQPLSLVHGEQYEDYSHGVRLVYPIVSINGSPVALKKLINTPEWNRLFTKEGEIDIEELSLGN